MSSFNPLQNGRARGRHGFTILELLIVISIMAIIATLATGAAVKALRHSKEKRVDATGKALELALANYRAQENEWPFSISDLKVDTRDSNTYWLHGKDNVKAFKKLYHGKKGASDTAYLDAAAFLGWDQSDGVVNLRAALAAGKTDVAIGYTLPTDSRYFVCYCIRFSPLTDTVKVVRGDRAHPHKRSGGEDFVCPQWEENP